MHYTILATFTALIAYAWFFIQVGKARKLYGVEAPKTTGDVHFERVFRVLQNTIEHMVIFLPSLWIFGYHVSDALAGTLGLAWTGARALYAIEAYSGTKKRGAGAPLTALIELTLLIAGTIGALLRS